MPMSLHDMLRQGRHLPGLADLQYIHTGQLYSNKYLCIVTSTYYLLKHSSTQELEYVGNLSR